MVPPPAPSFFAAPFPPAPGLPAGEAGLRPEPGSYTGAALLLSVAARSTVSVGSITTPWSVAARATLQAGFERFVAFDKGEFVGREALLRERERGSTHVCPASR
jgi:hypothetical protein